VSIIEQIFKLLFIVALAVFGLELVRNATGVGTILNDSANFFGTGLAAETAAGSGKQARA